MALFPLYISLYFVVYWSFSLFLSWTPTVVLSCTYLSTPCCHFPQNKKCHLANNITLLYHFCTILYSVPLRNFFKISISRVEYCHYPSEYSQEVLPARHVRSCKSEWLPLQSSLALVNVTDVTLYWLNAPTCPSLQTCWPTRLAQRVD